jgi:putative spermidine/putrescine transport system substrate-binding protein
MRDQPVGVIWDRQLYEFDAFAVPKGDPRKDAAMDFIRFATSSQPLAREADWVPYGPARRSSLAFVGRNPELGTAMAAFLPTAPANFATAFAIDDSWWRRHGDAIAPRWEAWLGPAP